MACLAAHQPFIGIHHARHKNPACAGDPAPPHRGCKQRVEVPRIPCASAEHNEKYADGDQAVGHRVPKASRGRSTAAVQRGDRTIYRLDADREARPLPGPPSCPVICRWQLRRSAPRHAASSRAQWLGRRKLPRRSRSERGQTKKREIARRLRTYEETLRPPAVEHAASSP